MRLMPNKPISLRAPRADERPELGPSSLDALYQDQERRVAMSKGCWRLCQLMLSCILRTLNNADLICYTYAASFGILQ